MLRHLDAIALRPGTLGDLIDIQISGMPLTQLGLRVDGDAMALTHRRAWQPVPVLAKPCEVISSRARAPHKRGPNHFWLHAVTVVDDRDPIGCCAAF